MKVILCFLALTLAHAAKPCLFLTGGSGYLGRNIIREFTKKGIRVHAIGRSPAALKAIQEEGGGNHIQLGRVTVVNLM